jgi:hypothetical protein
MGNVDMGTFAGAASPPITGTRMIAAPFDEVMIVPVKVVVQPYSKGKAGTE